MYYIYIYIYIYRPRRSRWRRRWRSASWPATTRGARTTSPSIGSGYAISFYSKGFPSIVRDFLL